MSAFCENCTCGRAQAANGIAGANGAPGRAEANVLAAPEARELQARDPRSFTSPADWQEPTEGIEPAVPLRSKEWFSKPDDG